MVNPNPEKIIEQLPTPEVPDSGESNFRPEGMHEIGGSREQAEETVGMELPQHFSAPPAPLTPQEQEFKKVEFILEEGLEDMYVKMMPIEQQKFKVKGEEATNLIIRLMHQPKIKIKKIFQLIKDWLKMIPGINKFFLEQTAKIKTDKILAQAKEEKNQNNLWN
ncbi:MAG: hypothetical protein WC244_00245 [Patescibacteria group bacterium]|jgi:hypothetical protein